VDLYALEEKISGLAMASTPILVMCPCPDLIRIYGGPNRYQALGRWQVVPNLSSVTGKSNSASLILTARFLLKKPCNRTLTNEVLAIIIAIARNHFEYALLNIPKPSTSLMVLALLCVKVLDFICIKRIPRKM
jgi:hypothetical protein